MQLSRLVFVNSFHHKFSQVCIESVVSFKRKYDNKKSICCRNCIFFFCKEFLPSIVCGQGQGDLTPSTELPEIKCWFCKGNTQLCQGLVPPGLNTGPREWTEAGETPAITKASEVWDGWSSGCVWCVYQAALEPNAGFEFMTQISGAQTWLTQTCRDSPMRTPIIQQHHTYQRHFLMFAQFNAQ